MCYLKFTYYLRLMSDGHKSQATSLALTEQRDGMRNRRSIMIFLSCNNNAEFLQYFISPDTPKFSHFPLLSFKAKLN